MRKRAAVSVTNVLSAVLLSWAWGSLPAAASDNQDLNWRPVAARGLAALSTEIFEVLEQEASQGGGPRDDPRAAFLRLLEQQNRTFDQDLHLRESNLGQSIAMATEAASRLAAVRRERGYLSDRFQTLARELARTDTEMNRLARLASETDQTLRMRFRHSRSYFLARGFIEVPRRCLKFTSIDHRARVLEASRAQALQESGAALDLSSLPVAFQADATELLDAMSRSVSPAPGAVMLTFESSLARHQAAPSEASEATGDMAAVAEQQAGEAVAAVSEPEPAGDAGGQGGSPPEDMFRLFLLTLLMVEISDAGGETNDDAGGDTMTTNRRAAENGCDPSELEVRVNLDRRAPALVQWPESWRLQERLATEDYATLQSAAHEMVRFWESLISELNEAQQSAWVEDWRTTRLWVGQERRALTLRRQAIAEELGAVHGRLQRTAGVRHAMVQLTGTLERAGELRDELRQAVSAGTHALTQLVDFTATPELFEDQAKRALERGLRRAAEKAGERYLSKIASYLGPGGDPGRHRARATVSAYVPLSHEVEPGVGGDYEHKVEMALRFEVEVDDGLLAPIRLFTLEDRRRLATFLPSQASPSRIVDQLTWRVPEEAAQTMTWHEAADAIRQLPQLANCSSWRLPKVAELQTILQLDAENCTIFPELGLKCADRVWASERMGASDNYRALTFSSGDGGGGRPRPAFNASTNLKSLAVCEPDLAEFDRVPQLPAGVTAQLSAAGGVQGDER